MLSALNQDLPVLVIVLALLLIGTHLYHISNAHMIMESNVTCTYRLTLEVFLVGGPRCPIKSIEERSVRCFERSNSELLVQ